MLQRIQQNQIKSDFSRQTIESSPQAMKSQQSQAMGGEHRSQAIKEEREDLFNIDLDPILPSSENAGVELQDAVADKMNQNLNMLPGDRDSYKTQAMIANRLSRQPRNSEFVNSPDRQGQDLQDMDAPITDDTISSREKDIQLLNIEIQKGKLLIKHLLQVYKKRFNQVDIVQPAETEKQTKYKELQKK